MCYVRVIFELLVDYFLNDEVINQSQNEIKCNIHRVAVYLG